MVPYPTTGSGRDRALFSPVRSRLVEENAVSARPLTQARIDDLKPRKAVHTIRDGALKGFGVRVLPSGRKRFFLHTQNDGRRIWKIVGDADTLRLDEARHRARALRAAIRRSGDRPPSESEETRFETVAEEVFYSYGRHWKPLTRKVNRGYLRNQILPWFRGRQIADITRDDVERWFASLHATPVAADRSAPVLSVILREAEVYGYRPEGTNPCAGLRRYRRKGRERFLSEPELRRLALALERHETCRPALVALVRLLLLTGCRKSEIATLAWSSYREGHLFLPDSKTGPRTVWLSSPARAVLERLPREGRWVFCSEKTGRRLPIPTLEAFWGKVRAEAGLDDVRLHDLRHTYASIAIGRGETVVTTGRLLGHGNPETTLKYAHLSEDSVRRAAAALGDVLGGGEG